MSIRQKIGICGRTGSGKTSLPLTLLRFLGIFTGTISINGIDLQKFLVGSYAPGWTRFHKIPLCYPDQFVWMPIRVELLQMKQSLLASLRLVCGPAFRIVAGSMPKCKISCFHKDKQQLFCRARLMLRKSKIAIILGEATSSVYTETDQLKVIREEFKGHTIG